jgi:hypothetical protein
MREQNKWDGWGLCLASVAASLPALALVFAHAVGQDRGRMLGLRSKNQHRDNEGVGGPWASGSLGTCVDEQIYRLCVGFRAGMHADRQAVGGWGALYPSPPTSHIDPAAVKSKSINHTQTKPSRFLRQRNATHLSRLCAATAGPPAYILNTDARIE